MTTEMAFVFGMTVGALSTLAFSLIGQAVAAFARRMREKP